MSDHITILAENENFKAVITPEEDQFEVNVYQWSDVMDDDGNILWQRISGPFIVDNEEQAEIEAQKQLDLFSGEESDEAISDDFIQQVAELLGHEDFQCYKAQNYDIQRIVDADEDATESIEAQKIISTEDVFIVETDDEKWLIGFLAGDREIQCWKSFDTLEDAIDDLEEEE